MKNISSWNLKKYTELELVDGVNIPVRNNDYPLFERVESTTRRVRVSFSFNEEEFKEMFKVKK